jgi:elongation factor Ts
MPSSDSEGDNELGKTVEEAIVKAIGVLGENITLRRAAIVNQGISASFLHGGDGSTGKIGGLAVLNTTEGDLSTEQSNALIKAARQVARQAVGFNPLYATERDVPMGELEKQADKKAYLEEVVLSNQAYLMNNDQTVSQFVEKVGTDNGLTGAQLVDFVRWEAGENIEKRVDNFTEDVMKAARGQ